jgi:hypothetical protein
MDLRPLVPWVFSQLGDQPDGVGRPYRQVPRRMPALRPGGLVACQ